MTVIIQVPREIEADLVAEAIAQGVGLPEYVEHLLRQQIVPRPGNALSPAERAAAWVESSRDLPHTLPLSDEAISRENINIDRDQ